MVPFKANTGFTCSLDFELGLSRGNGGKFPSSTAKHASITTPVIDAAVYRYAHFCREVHVTIKGDLICCRSV